MRADETLSKREREVVVELQQGGRVATIAKKLSVSPTTVRNHLQRIFWKLGVHSQAELVEYARANPETFGPSLSPDESARISEIEARYWQARHSS